MGIAVVRMRGSDAMGIVAMDGVIRNAGDPGSVKVIHRGGVNLIHPFVQWSPVA